MLKKYYSFLGLSLALAIGLSVLLPRASYADGQGTASCEGSGNPSGSDFSASCVQHDQKGVEPIAPQPAPGSVVAPPENTGAEATEDWRETLKKNNYSVRESGNGTVLYYESNDGKSCVAEDGTPGIIDRNAEYWIDAHSPGIEAIGAVKGAPRDSIPPCITNDNTADQKQEDEQASYEKKVAEAKKAFSDMTIATPELQFNDNTDPHVWVDKNVNFYVKLGDAKTRKTSALNGEVQIEAVPVHYHFDAGNGYSFNTYTAGGPIDLRETEEMPKTQTSYVYEKTGNFHAYVTVTYEGRYRFGSGPWRPLNKQVTKRSVDPTLVRVWTSEVHSVAKTCDEDPTGWACPLNDKYRDFNNPNPKLRRPDPVTGQRWHKDDIGAGDTEWRLHPKWPDM